MEMTRVVSAEGAALVEAQTSALFGDLKRLQRQMQVRARLPRNTPSTPGSTQACLRRTVLCHCLMWLLSASCAAMVLMYLCLPVSMILSPWTPAQSAVLP